MMNVFYLSSGHPLSDVCHFMASGLSKSRPVGIKDDTSKITACSIIWLKVSNTIIRYVSIY
jgi:hypothetical protein